MSSRRALFLFALVAAVGVGTALRLQTRPELTAGGRVHALTSDDNYHLRRARFAVASYPRTILFDRLMNFPGGGVPIWPPLFDLALATPARLFHGAGASAAVIQRGAAWVPVFFAGGTILLAGLLGREVLGDIGGMVLALFIAVCPGHILWTQYGHSDQHVAESFFGMLVLWLFLASRGRSTSKGSLPWEIATGVALALATLAWQGAIYWGAIFALSLFLEAVLTRRGMLAPAIWILGLSAAIVAAATAWWLEGFRPPLTYISFGFFQPLFLAALAGGTILLDSILALVRRRLSRREMAIRLTAVAIMAVAVLPGCRELLAGFGRGLQYAAGRTAGEITTATGYISYPKNWLNGIFEARPLLADGPALAIAQLSLAFFVTPLAILLWASRAIKGERTGIHCGLAVWGTVTLGLALSQRMDVYYAAPLAGASLVETARLAGGWARSRRERVLATIAVSLLLAAPFARSVAQEVRSVHPAGSDLYATLDWMKREIPHAVDPYDPRLLSPSTPLPELDRAASVIAPWSLGHLILYESGLPVVANNFGYGFTDSLKFFLAETEEEALTIARRRRARWVLATDLVPRMNDYASYIGQPASLTTTNRGLVPTDRYFQTLQSRLYDFDGIGLKMPRLTVAPLAHFRLRFHSATAIRRGNRWVARWKVFEILD